MVGERLVKGAVFLALIVLATGCRHKDEPLKPLVIVDKPAKEEEESVVSLTPFSVLYVEGFFPEDCLVLGNVLVS